MPSTARKHFDADLGRARELVRHARMLPPDFGSSHLRGDMLRSGWVFGVGALDAYFCDAYSSLIANTLISKQRQESMVLPKFFLGIRVPIRAILEPYDSRSNWRWRMAARELMKWESVIQLEQVKKLFNKFLPEGKRFFGDVLPEWIGLPSNGRRLFGISPIEYQRLSSAARQTATQQAIRQFEDRFHAIFQRRHDCVHECDRPRAAPQPLKSSKTVEKVLVDVEFLVHRCDEHVDACFREFLQRNGCTASTIAQIAL